MKSKPNKFGQLAVSCIKQRWSLHRYEQKLRRYYAEEYYVHQGRYYIDREQYRKENRFYAVPGWIRDHVNDERQRRKQERLAKREKAQRKLQQAVANGVLKKPQQCEHCKRRLIRRKLQGHHRDYRYPHRVIWLCQSCHVQAQGKRAVKRAALHARRREVRQRFDKKEEKLRLLWKAGEISRRRYHELRREAFSKSMMALV